MSKRVSVHVVKEFPALGYLYNNVCNDVTCVTLFAGIAVVLRDGPLNF